MQVFKPHDYQQYAIEKIINTKKVGLFLEMGLGKTICVLTAIQKLKFDYFDINKVLIIAPLNVAKSTWSQELEKWKPVCGINLKMSKVLGLKQNREKALSEDSDIYVINRENVPWITELYKKKWPFDVVVIDELSSFKSSKAQRFKSLKKVISSTNRVIGLTGTPAPNSLLDLWPQLYLIDRGERLGKTITEYKNRYFYPGDKNYQTGVIYNWNLKDNAKKEIFSRIEDICISMKAKDYINLPKKINNNIIIELDKNIMKKYKELEKEKVLELSEEVITASSAAVVTNKLLQFSNGAIYDDDKKVNIIHDLKIDTLGEILDTVNGKSVLVFYNYKHDLDRLKNAFKSYKPKEIKSEKDIENWNLGKIKLLLAHPASAGHGLNLQAGGNIVVWFGLTWSLEYYQQANARLYRQGQKESVIIHHLICKDTIDEDVLKVLETKNTTQNMLLESLKARIRRYKN